MTKGWAMGCGFALGTVGIKVLKSKLARKGYPYAVAGAMLVRDWVMEESERIQAGASDIADQAKAITELQDGDTIILLADRYDYQQNYEDSYHFGKPLTVSGDLQVSNVYLPDKTKALVTYRFTDIYNQNYWTPIIGK